MANLFKTLLSLLIAAIMLYFPYWWCHIKGEREADLGLLWFMSPDAWRDVFLALALTLIPLTFVSMHWPVEWGGPGPFRPSLWNALNFIGGGLAAAFIEETFFRGWLQTLTVRKLGAFTGITLATFLFACSHLIVMPGWLRMATFFPGLVMALLRHRHGSVLPSIIYHAVCNVWAVWWAPMP